MFFFSCQFLVKQSDKDYAPYFADPDLLVDWNDVEQIVRVFIKDYLIRLFS